MTDIRIPIMPIRELNRAMLRLHSLMSTAETLPATEQSPEETYGLPPNTPLLSRLGDRDLCEQSRQ